MNVKPKLKKYKNYYDGIQDILSKSYPDASKPCAHTVMNYCKNIVDSYAGYLASPDHISYNSDNDISEIMDILKYNDYQAEDSDFLTNALIYGTSAELMFVDSEGKARFRVIDPRQCFGIFDDTLSEDLLYFVRFYPVSQWDNSDDYFVDVYDDTFITTYTMNDQSGFVQYLSQRPHNFSQCPANIFYLKDEKSIFDSIISLQDAVNELLSGEIDDYSAFCDAYLAITGADAESDEITAMKENRVLILPEGATASWLTKNANDAQVENILKRLHEAIYRIAQCPDFSSESFVGGVSSGIAIRYRLTGMEDAAAAIEARMKKALQRRVEILCGYCSLLLGDEVFRDIIITFKRNIPEDLNAIANVVNSLRGFVSDKTLLTQIPFITDINNEIAAVQEQKAANIELYSFNEDE